MFKILALFCTVSTLFAAPKVLVGIAGGTGSGKTTIAEKIHQAFPDHSVLISQDSYYRDRQDLSFEQRCAINFDHPNSLEFSLLRQHLLDLMAGNSIEVPTYNFSIHARDGGVTVVEPADIVIVEGILLFAVPELSNLFDIKIFVDTDSDVRVIRRMERDIRERGRTLSGVQQQYLTTVKPMHEAFVEPSKRFADIIIPEGGYNDTALNLILAGIKARLE